MSAPHSLTGVFGSSSSCRSAVVYRRQTVKPPGNTETSGGKLLIMLHTVKVLLSTHLSLITRQQQYPDTAVLWLRTTCSSFSSSRRRLPAKTFGFWAEITICPCAATRTEPVHTTLVLHTRHTQQRTGLHQQEIKHTTGNQP